MGKEIVPNSENKKKDLRDKAGNLINDKRHHDVCFAAEQRVVQVLDILKEISDENHPVKQAEIMEAMKETKKPKTNNPATLAKTIKEILLGINPSRYKKSNEPEYRIRYEGYQDNILVTNEKSKKTPSITNLSYVHDFSYKELDQLMDAVNSSGRLSLQDKENLMMKLQKTASKYYKSPFYNKETGRVRFYESGIYSRLHGRNVDLQAEYVKEEMVRSIHVIQEAIQKGIQISFDFCSYNHQNELVPNPVKSQDGRYRLSPYYIVVYHEMYYLIGGMKGNENAMHYRIDLMQDVALLLDREGLEIPVEPLRNFKNLPTKDKWNPEQYMREHLYMFYDVPKKIRLKIRKDSYTMLHDWFGTHYKVYACEEEGWDYVDVTCSPDAMVHFAMQYAGRLEVMDEEVKKEIRREMKHLEKYNSGKPGRNFN
ncbi:MAG: WYL domain-containing protein [Lachnospiraceae bacterium]